MNPIKKTIDQHKKANQKIRATTIRMSQLYTEARAALNQRLAKFVLGYADPLVGKHLVEMIHELEKGYASMAADLGKELGSAVPYVAQSYYFDALHDIGKSVLGGLDKAKIELLRTDAFTHVAGMTQNMLKGDVQFIRQAANEVFNLAGITGMTRQQTSDMLLGKIMGRPEKFTFVAADGRIWGNQAYCEMLSRTVLLNAGRETYFNTCAENGYDAVRVTVSGNPCPACAVWENRLLSITGKTAGLPTVSDAMAAGLGHPNCTHSFVAVPDFIREEDFTANGRPKSGLNAPGKEEKADKEAWAAYRKANQPQKPKPTNQAPAATGPAPMAAKPEQQTFDFDDQFQMSEPLTEGEIREINWYTGHEHKAFNEYLRNLAPDSPHNKNYDQKTRLLNAAINKSVAKNDIVLLRGINSSYLRKKYEKKPPVEIPIFDFQSTTSAAHTARAFAGGNVILIIDCPKGAHALPVKKFSKFSGENEKLLKNSGIFKVKRQYEKDGLLYMEVTYVEHS